MKTDQFYTLARLHGVPYLLPFGQNIAGLRYGFRLNETGVFLWNMLCKAKDRTEMENAYLSYSGASAEERSEALADLDSFLYALKSNGILAEEQRKPAAALYACLRIGPLSLALYGPENVFAEDFRAFQSEPSALPCQSVTVTEDYPPESVGAEYVLQNPELDVLRRKTSWQLRFPSFSFVRMAVLSEDGASAAIYVSAAADAADEETRREEVYHVLRHLFLYFAQRNGCFALHSAAVLYRDRAWLFSAPSGTGKSTHAALWKQEFSAEQLNGDLGLLSFDEHGASFHGMPWCGTSEISRPGSRRLGGIVLLRQGTENALESLSADACQLRVLNRLISPAWTEAQLRRNLDFTEALTDRVPVWRFACTPRPEAAWKMRAEIDRTLEAEK